MQTVVALAIISTLLCCCVSPFMKRKRLLISYALLVFIVCCGAYSAMNHLYYSKLPDSREMNLTGFNEETQMALKISESEARELRRALRELSGVLMALPFALGLFWFFIHRELCRETKDTPATIPQESDELQPGSPGEENTLLLTPPAPAPLTNDTACDLEVTEAS